MAVYARESLSGYIVSDPQLTRTKKGEARFYARVRQDHYQRHPDGTYQKLDPTYTDLVLFNKAAMRAHAALRKGDAFLAEGRTHLYTTDTDGVQVQRDQFIASRVGHDANLTNYQIDRTPRTKEQAPSATMRESPIVEALTHREQHLPEPTTPTMAAAAAAVEHSLPAPTH